MKLEDINKNHIFKVPDRYFDELPSRIQEKILSGKSTREYPAIIPGKLVWLSIPASMFLLVIAGIYLFQDKSLSPEELLAQVSTETLIQYIEDSDLTSDELLDMIDPTIVSDELYEEPVMEDMELSEEELDRLINTLENEDDYL